MKNVTVTLAPEVAHWARVWAAQHDTSVSRLLGELLRERMEAESGYQAAMEKFLSHPPAELKEKRQRYPSREEIHER